MRTLSCATHLYCKMMQPSCVLWDIDLNNKHGADAAPGGDVETGLHLQAVRHNIGCKRYQQQLHKLRQLGIVAEELAPWPSATASASIEGQDRKMLKPPDSYGSHVVWARRLTVCRGSEATCSPSSSSLDSKLARCSSTIGRQRISALDAPAKLDSNSILF